MALRRLGMAALDTLFPPRCFGCGGYGSFLCPPCNVSAPCLEPPFCRICAQPGATVGVCIECAHRPPQLEGITVPYLMQGAIREGVHSLKYRNVRAAAPTLGGLLARCLEPKPPMGALVPVPLHKKRLRRRGYNQSTLLAREVGKRTGLPVEEAALTRTRDTPPQVGLSHAERARNVEGSFTCVGDVAGRSFILVDDVVTTGSTMFACAKALKATGAASVWGLALAREGPNS